MSQAPDIPQPPMSRPHPWQGLRVNDKGQALCKAKRSNGEQCNALAMKGQQVCRKHGGASPQARRKAQLRLAELVNPAIATLAREMAQADRSNDRQRAANSILDRAGVPRSVTSPDGEAARELLLERLHQMRQQQGLDPQQEDEE